MITNNSSLSDVVLAHDSFTQLGGAERVFEAIQELFPNAEVYTIVKDEQFDELYISSRIITSPLQFLYNLYPHFQRLFPLIPIVLTFFRLKPSRVLISSSSSYIKGLRKSAGSTHINYCHTPTRFLWLDSQHAYDEIHPLLRPLARAYFSWLKGWDLRAVRNVDYFIANSREVQQRIKQFYGRDSEIIYPFVDVTFWHPVRSTKEGYFLIAGRLQRAKGLETVIRAFNELGKELHVVGNGRHESYLRSIARPNIQFLGRLSDEALREEYSAATGFIYPQLEDFGIMPLEAAACGTATLALARGGSLETVIPERTGELFDHATKEVIKQAVADWNAAKYQLPDLQAHAARFSKQVFKNNLRAFVQKVASV